MLQGAVEERGASSKTALHLRRYLARLWLEETPQDDCSRLNDLCTRCPCIVQPDEPVSTAEKATPL